MNYQYPLSIKRSLSAVTLTLAAVIFTACGQSSTLTFSEYTDQLFIEEVSSNTLTLHYTLSDPEAWGITDTEPSLGDYSADTRKNRATNLQSLLSDIKKYDSVDLEPDEALTYDVLCDYLQTELDLCEYELYEEPLLSSGGVAMEIPLLLAEYTLDDTSDVEDYLGLLAQIGDYFAEIETFEQEKADAGLFMSDRQCQEVCAALRDFISGANADSDTDSNSNTNTNSNADSNSNTDSNFNTDSNSIANSDTGTSFNADSAIGTHYLITTFTNKLAKLNLSDEESAAYEERNRELFLTEVVPAYKALLDTMTSLCGTGSNDMGLYYYEQGREYYELLVYADTGCSDEISDIFNAISNARTNDLAVCANLLAADDTLALRAFTYEWEYDDDMEMLEVLCAQMTNDFPTAPEVSYRVCAVDPALEPYMAPAFYISVPLDNYLENTIYINGAYSYSDIYYFTTLAHEGFPGHLYQTVMSCEYDIDPIRTLLNYPGYTEGWATYVEMIAYSYAGLDDDLASLLMHNQAATLSLYASSDIGLHYYGWTMQQLCDFWAEYGVDDVSTVNAIAELILDKPGNYLKYYVGYLEFLKLKEEAISLWGSDYSDLAFHEAVLRLGPAPFDLLEEYLS